MAIATAADRNLVTARVEAETPESMISIRNLRKQFGDYVAVRDFSLDVARGEVVSLLGASGCGKTTTLRCLAGLETPTSGEIVVRGRAVYSQDERINLLPERRGLSMVFQQYALWPHMTVFENVAFGVQMKKLSAAAVRESVKKALERVRLWNKHDSRISELSGGQQQRVALARALAIDPEVILFDEPLSNLDAKLREELRLELLELQRELRFTAIYVTHDQEEAISLSSRIVIMNNGICEQIDTPEKIWRAPATSYVARFIGSTNALAGQVTAKAPDGTGLCEITTHAGPKLQLPDRADLGTGEEVELFVRMSDVVLGGEEMEAQRDALPSRVLLASFQGDTTLYEVEFGNRRLIVRTSGDAKFREGDRVFVSVPPEAVRVYGASR